MKKLNIIQIGIVAIEIKKNVEKMRDFSNKEPAFNVGCYGKKIELLTDLILNGYNENLGFKVELSCITQI